METKEKRIAFHPSLGGGKYASTFSIRLRDHFRKRRQINGFSTEKQAEHYAKQIQQIISCRTVNEVPTPDLIRWVKKSMHGKMKSKLLEWGILDNDLFGEKKVEVTPLSEYLADYKVKLKKGFKPKLNLPNTEYHVNQCHKRVRRIIDGCGFKVWSDIRFDTAEDFLRDLDIKKLTFNYYARDFQQFVGWIIKKGSEQLYPQGGEITRFQIKRNKKPARRDLSPEETRLLIQATESTPKAFGMTGHERAVLYLTACETGYRTGELSRLTVADFDLFNGYVNLDETRTKNREDAWQPIKKRRLLQYRLFFADMQPTDRVFSFWKNSRGAEMLKKDLVAAGIKIKDSRGVQADFHSLRYTFCTQVDRLNLSEAEKDRLTRHSNSNNLRKSIYTQIDEDRIKEAIEQLPFEWPKVEEESNVERNESHDSAQKVG